VCKKLYSSVLAAGLETVPTLIVLMKIVPYGWGCLESTL